MRNWFWNSTLVIPIFAALAFLLWMAAEVLCDGKGC